MLKCCFLYDKNFSRLQIEKNMRHSPRWSVNSLHVELKPYLLKSSSLILRYLKVFSHSACLCRKPQMSWLITLLNTSYHPRRRHLSFCMQPLHPYAKVIYLKETLHYPTPDLATLIRPKRPIPPSHQRAWSTAARSSQFSLLESLTWP